jgi:hypothetical protein
MTQQHTVEILCAGCQHDDAEIQQMYNSAPTQSSVPPQALPTWQSAGQDRHIVREEEEYDDADSFMMLDRHHP